MREAASATNKFVKKGCEYSNFSKNWQKVSAAPRGAKTAAKHRAFPQVLANYEEFFTAVRAYEKTIVQRSLTASMDTLEV